MPSRRWGFLAVLVLGVCAAIGVYGVYRADSDAARGASRQSQPGAGRTTGFEERATAAGLTWAMNFLPAEQGWDYKINPYDHGSGVAVGDFDGDGLDDIYLVNQMGANALYRNKGDGTFEDVTVRAGVGLGDRVCVAATWADYDNSGRQSLFVTSTRGGNVLFKNLGNGNFKDVTKQAGLTLVGHCQTAVFFDYDNDGYLDLLVTRTADWTKHQLNGAAHYYPGAESLWDLASRPKEYNVLYHNNRDGTFTDVTSSSGLRGTGWNVDAAVFDYDGDGYLDVLITCMFGPSKLYHNERNGTFRDVTQQTLGRTSWGGMGARAFDFNNDGRLDLLIVDMHSDMWLPSVNDPDLQEIARQNQHVKFPTVSGAAAQYVPNAAEQERKLNESFHIHQDQVVFGNTFFQNLGGGKFAEISGHANLETFWPWGIVTGDFNNDGWTDVFIPSGMGYPFFYWPNALMMNNGNGTFSDHARAEGIEPPARGVYQDELIKGKPAARSSRTAAVADFTRSGRLDLVVNNFNDQPYFFANRFQARHWIEFRLHGTQSNRDAIGALVKISVGKQTLVRQVQGAGGYLSQSSKIVHFGLGDHDALDRVEIVWPRGRRQIIVHPALNQLHDITEPAG